MAQPTAPSAVQHPVHPSETPGGRPQARSGHSLAAAVAAPPPSVRVTRERERERESDGPMVVAPVTYLWTS